MNALIVKNKPINGILWTKVFPYSKELKNQLQRTLMSGQTIVHNPDFDLEKYKVSANFV